MSVFGVSLDFILFGATLLGVALFSNRTLTVAVIGLALLLGYKLVVKGDDAPSWFADHAAHHWVELANLALLLTGFALLARYFEESQLPELAPDILPDDWKAGLVLLAIVFVLSAVLDNIASALIGATIAAHVYQRKVHIGFLAAIVAAANAGGAGSVIGDTTTTIMWIGGKSPLDVAHAFLASAVALAVIAVPASLAQDKYAPALKHDAGGVKADWVRIGIVAFVLICAVSGNLVSNLFAPALLETTPVIGLCLWGALLLSHFARRADWSVLPGAAKESLFLLALVFAASLLPVEGLPAASAATALGLGFVSAVFNNIPLVALALKQGGYDWGVLAYAVGFGGSMIWFGSSAGVAVANLFPEAKSTLKWLRAGWFVPIAYVAGFFALIAILGWRPQP